MAKVLLGAIASGIKGSVGGTTIQGSGNTHILRNKPQRRAKFNEAVNINQAVFSFFARRWRSLSSSEVALWQGLTSSYTKVDGFGNNYTPKAFNLYMAINIGQWKLNNAPLSTPAVPDSYNFTNNNVQILTGGSILELIWDFLLGSTAVLQIFATAPCSTGKAAPSSAYKWIDIIPPSGGPIFNIKPNYVAIFGTPPLESRIFFRFQLIDPANGSKSQYVYNTAFYF